MPLTENGLTIRRFPQVEQDLQDALTQNLNTALSFDSDTLLGQLVTIIGADLADKEALLQAIYDSFDIDKAEGTSLDRLTALISVNRLEPATSKGVQQFVGQEGVVISEGFTLINPSSSEEFVTLFELTLSPNSCESVTYSVDAILDNTTYQVSVNGTDFTYTTGTGETANNIASGLAASINLPATRTWEATLDGDNLVISTTDQENIIVEAITFLLVESVTASIEAESVLTGEIRAPANSITELGDSVVGITSTTNPLAYSTGREAESDEELRLRAKNSTQLAGSATVPSHISAVSNVDGVSAVSLVENLTGEVDAEGRPPNSYEIIVDGGVDGDIALAIHENRPVGILSFGNITINILDDTGDIRPISFSRPEDIVMAVRVTYSLYQEEPLSVNTAKDIKSAVDGYGNSLGIGVDVIPSRFIGPIYGNTSGLNVTSVETQRIVTQGDVPSEASGVITSVTENNGKARFNISGTQPVIDQYITLSGMSEPSYNGTHQVVLTNAAYFEVDLDFEGNDAGSYSSWSTSPLPVSASQVASFSELDTYTNQI